MTVQSFIADVAPDAAIASARTGLPESVILAQWGNETGWGTSDAWLRGHNYAGVSPGGSVGYYPDRASGLAAYISTMMLPYYNSVRSAGTNPTTVAEALGASPWAAGRYLNGKGGGPGSALVDEISAYGLTGYDTPAAAPVAPTVPPSPSSPIATTVGFDPLNPLGSGADAIASKVVGLLVDAIKTPAIIAVLLTGAAGLAGLAAWRATAEPRARYVASAKDKAGHAATIAAAAA
ncbi:MAG TPA: glucosaminidase domain-containing protein [Acidimicrobiales bacterium]|nr:glucosaminidase domain-containing protein [Acidimicrobiales bacterium]